MAVVEGLGCHDFVDIDVAVDRMDNRCAGLEVAYDGFDFFELVCAEQVAFVQDDKVAEFDLVNDQCGNFFLREVVLVGQVVALFFFML